ncbi:glutamyl-tRNA reductase [Streptomyces sp. XD-27]|uniref:glutamyl-tRNA reductase n=1 Tax=Streptomyces sp. XD-27 TaxID=3062779 RepID=UPI0026F45A7D|nr:glutamyl-tRNA reductase [Streptomyces sp. XD-27]WKX71859.1 glutamyl-tRNA reductase [Streptomyces sp. XD-27]
MTLLVVGLSHRSAPVSVLERAALSADQQAKLLQDTLAAEPAAEAAVLATCNRIELYADVDKFHAGVAELSTLLAQHSGVGLDELTPYLYVHYEDRAVHHLFSVACGLDSMVVGEGQILGQIKDALALGQELHTAGRLLNDLFQQALRVGKRAHSETGIDKAGQSLVTFGLEQLAAGTPVADWVAGKRALVIGAGSMSSLAATTLARAGVAELVIANRTLERAERLADALAGRGTGAGTAGMPSGAGTVPPAFGAAPTVTAAGSDALRVADVIGIVPGAHTDAGRPAAADPAADATAVGTAGAACPVHPADVTAAPLVARAVSIDAVAAELPHAEIVVSCTGATGLVLTVEDLRTAFVQRAACPGGQDAQVALLDLAMPRDIDAAVHRLDGARLVDIETLAEASADAPMAADVDRVRGIVSAEVAAFAAAQRAAHITPTVVALRTMAADVVAGEIARLDGRLPDLDDKQRAEITQTVRRVVDKLLHAPTVRVKQLASTPGGAGYADALRELFDLDPQAVAAVSRADLNDVNGGRA